MRFTNYTHTGNNCQAALLVQDQISAKIGPCCEDIVVHKPGHSHNIHQVRPHVQNKWPAENTWSEFHFQYMSRLIYYRVR